jgi:hypothetical protein
MRTELSWIAAFSCVACTGVLHAPASDAGRAPARDASSPREPDAFTWNDAAPAPSMEEIEEGIAARRALVLAWSELLPPRSGAAKYRAYDVLARSAARGGCGPAEDAAYMASLGALDFQVDDNFFALPALVRYLYTYGDCVSEAQKGELLAGLERAHHLFAHGTANHAIMQASSWYLLAQYFADATWTNADGARYDSAAVMARLADLLRQRTEGFFRQMHAEIFSTTYAMVNLYPLLNLIELAADPIVAARANAEASLEILLLTAHSFHGNVVPPITRRNIDQTNAAWPEPTGVFPSITQHVLWYYFGEPAYGRYDFIQERREPYFVVFFALSSWRPPAIAWALPTSGYSARTTTPDFTHWGAEAPPLLYGDSYFGAEYALATGNASFDPSWYSSHNQTFSVTLRSDAVENKIECQHPYWRSDLGEDAWTTDLWSPFVQSHRIDAHRAVLIADIPAADPWVYGADNRFFAERDDHRDALIHTVQCRVPLSADEVIFEDRWIFVREGASFVALASLAGDLERASDLPDAIASRFEVVKIREARTAIFVMVEDARTSLEDFRARARAALPSYDGASGSVETTASGVPVTVRFRLRPEESTGRWLAWPDVTAGGAVIDPSSHPVFETPFLELAGGVLSGPGGLALSP